MSQNDMPALPSLPPLEGLITRVEIALRQISELSEHQEIFFKDHTDLQCLNQRVDELVKSLSELRMVLQDSVNQPSMISRLVALESELRQLRGRCGDCSLARKLKELEEEFAEFVNVHEICQKEKAELAKQTALLVKDHEKREKSYFDLKSFGLKTLIAAIMSIAGLLGLWVLSLFKNGLFDWLRKLIGP